MPAVPTGSYRLAEQIGAWAVFADLTLCAIARGAEHPLVAIADGVVVDDYGRDVASIGLGVAYALSCIPNSNEVGVIVQRLHTNPVDTTPMALAFTACHAALDCFNEKPSILPYFDRETRSFVFPARGPVD